MGNVMFARPTLHHDSYRDGLFRPSGHDWEPHRLAGVCLRASLIQMPKGGFLDFFALTVYPGPGICVQILSQRRRETAEFSFPI